MRQLRFAVVAAVAFSGIILGTKPVQAVPLLQLYIEGSTYSDSTESWELTSTGGTLRLWVIGNLTGPGGAGDIEDVKLSIVYDSILSPITITLTPSTTNDFGGLGFTDSSVPDLPIFNGENVGGLPQLSGGKDLSNHGQYDKNGTTRTWQEFLLGDLTESDSPIANFIDSVPTAPLALGGQINVYEVTVSSANPGPFVLHFDVYNHVEGETDGVFAPFSHDAEGPPGEEEIPPPGLPEPSSVILFGLGAIGMIGYGYRRRKAELTA